MSLDVKPIDIEVAIPEGDGDATVSDDEWDFFRDMNHIKSSLNLPTRSPRKLNLIGEMTRESDSPEELLTFQGKPKQFKSHKSSSRKSKQTNLRKGRHKEIARLYGRLAYKYNFEERYEPFEFQAVPIEQFIGFNHWQ